MRPATWLNDEVINITMARLMVSACYNLSTWSSNASKLATECQQSDWERPWDGPLMFPPWDDGMALKIVCGNPVENNHGVPGGGSKCVETASWGLAKNPDNRWLEGGLVGNEQRELDQMQAQMEM